MNQRTKTGLAIMQAALILGLAGDVLLRVTPWGSNVLLFNIAFVAGMFTLLWRKAPEHLTGQTYALFGALIFFASMFAWRDAIELRVADTFTILAILAALFLPKLNLVPRLAGVFHYIASFVWAAGSSLFAPVALLLVDIDWRIIPARGGLKYVFAALRGVAIALPILLIFGTLFVAADAAYEGWVQRVFNLDPETVEIAFSHIALFSVFAWLSAGYLRGVLMNEDEPATAETETASASETVASRGGFPNDLSILEHINISEEPNAPAPVKDEKEDPPKKPWVWADLDNSLLPSTVTLGTVEIGVILGLINLLFLSFVLVQVPYLFGGMEFVQNTPDVKLADYARRGFGELVTVSALVLPMLLASHWLIRKDERLAGKLFRILAGIQIVLLFVIMASAAQRLFLLTGNLGYGLTTVRLYPMIFMGWLAVVFVWFAATVLRGARQHFAWGALWLAFLTLGATHFLNPDDLIVRTNIQLAAEGREFDAPYNSSLSDDAMPALLDSFEIINENDQRTVARQLAKRYCEKQKEGDLRSWNYSRWIAESRLASNQELVNEIGDCEDIYSRLGPELYHPTHDD